MGRKEFRKKKRGEYQSAEECLTRTSLSERMHENLCRSLLDARDKDQSLCVSRFERVCKIFRQYFIDPCHAEKWRDYLTPHVIKHDYDSYVQYLLYISLPPQLNKSVPLHPLNMYTKFLPVASHRVLRAETKLTRAMAAVIAVDFGLYAPCTFEVKLTMYGCEQSGFLARIFPYQHDEVPIECYEFSGDHLSLPCTGRTLIKSAEQRLLDLVDMIYNYLGKRTCLPFVLLTDGTVFLWSRVLLYGPVLLTKDGTSKQFQIETDHEVEDLRLFCSQF